MNTKIVLKTLGLLAVLLGVLMIIPGLVAVLYREPLGVATFAFSSLTAITVGILFKHLGADGDMGRKEAFVIVSCGWLLAATLGAFPYIYLGMGPIDAVFESMSGFTTAGATILKEFNSEGYWILNNDWVRGSLAYLFVEHAANFLLSHSPADKMDLGFGITLNLRSLLEVKGTYFGLLFWRSFTQLLGGLSIILLFIASLPNLGVAGRELYSVEGIGLTKESLTPRVKDTAKTFWGIYLSLMFLEAFILIIFGVPIYDSFCTAFASIATGGFSPKAYSIASYNNVFVEGIVCIFLLLGGTNFILYYQVIIKKSHKKLIDDTEFRIYILIVALSVLILLIWGRIPGDLWTDMRVSIFQVISTMTTTGFVNNFNYDAWSLAAKFILIMLMLIGSCTGSTGGGIKVGRVLIVLKYIYRELIHSLHPKAVITVRMGKKSLNEDVIKSVMLFVQLYLLIFFGATLAFAMIESDNSQFNAISAISAAASCLGVVGPGFGVVALDFSAVSQLGRILGIFCMYIGRLEVLPVILMFLPETWKE
ncbi:Cation transport protein [uncultured archaeon]|nr:Cation transport protein [uncultured archaeon]